MAKKYEHKFTIGLPNIYVPKMEWFL